MQRKAAVYVFIYEIKENFCAVAPDYLGKAHECVQYEFSHQKQEKERKALTRLIHDQFSKDYLEKLLSPYGEVQPGKTVVGEPRQIDVWFGPTEVAIPPELGLLGRMSATIALFEPYRNPATSEEICDCLWKLLEVRAESQRKAN